MYVNIQTVLKLPIMEHHTASKPKQNVGVLLFEQEHMASPYKPQAGKGHCKKADKGQEGRSHDHCGPQMREGKGWGCIDTFQKVRSVGFD